MTNAHTLVIGYGNPLRQDDGMGWRAAELLERKFSSGAVEVVQCHQLTPELAAKVVNASLVVFLDAACDQDPGAVSSAPVRAEGHVTWSHRLSPAQLLSLSQQLGSPAPPAVLVRGGILHAGLAEGLTELGEQTAAKMADVAHALLCSCE